MLDRAVKVVEFSDNQLDQCERDRTWADLTLRQHAKKSCKIRIRINGLRNSEWKTEGDYFNRVLMEQTGKGQDIFMNCRNMEQVAIFI